MQLSDFNEIKDSVTMQANAGTRNFRIAGLVIDAQHRVTKTGRNFGILSIEDFSGKTELALFGDDYVRTQNYLEKGKNVLVNGFFKQRFNTGQYEFKISSLTLLESIKQSMTKQLEISMHPSAVSEQFVTFVENNVKSHPGSSALRFMIHEPKDNIRISLYSLEKGFTMNDEMAFFLMENPDVEVSVSLAG
jgi:DNA polymerase-3 subunit alpha